VEELAKYLKALVLLQLHSAPFAPNGASGSGATPTPSKPEVLLSRAGFTHREIADLLGKTPTAVAKAISRARPPKGVESDQISVGGEA
jgi:hypothetical protein